LKQLCLQAFQSTHYVFPWSNVGSCFYVVLDTYLSNCKSSKNYSHLCHLLCFLIHMFRNFHQPFKCSNSLGMVNIVSKGMKEIFPLKKCIKILDLTWLISPPSSLCPTTPFYSLSSPFLWPSIVDKGFLLSGTLDHEKLFLIPHS
jgi:hypothetical protein